MEYDFSVSFINVGSADCTLIKCGDKSVLIDGGTNLVTDKITAYLKRSSVTHLDAVIVSHPDSDKTVMITVENGEICTKTHA